MRAGNDIGGEKAATFTIGQKITWAEREITPQAQQLNTKGIVDIQALYPEDQFSVAYAYCEIQSDQEQPVHFFLGHDDCAKMWLNGELVVDNWRQNWLPWTHNMKLNMEKGKRYSIKIEWIPNGAYIGLKYLTPEIPTPKDQISLYSEVGDQIDYYFIFGEKTDDIISGYRTITGKAAMMPKWAMGMWQCRERYKTQNELLDVVKEFRKRQIPLDNIVQDWSYWPEDGWGDREQWLQIYLSS